MVGRRKPAGRKPGNKDIKAGTKDIEKSLLGPRGYGVLKGTEDIAKGIGKDMRSRKRK